MSELQEAMLNSAPPEIDLGADQRLMQLRSNHSLARFLARSASLIAISLVTQSPVAAFARNQPSKNKRTTSVKPQLFKQLELNSNNWDGYAVHPLPQGTRTVEEGFTVPNTVNNCQSSTLAEDEHTLIWVGLGKGQTNYPNYITGVSSNDPLYQTGVDIECSDGQASYQAWWEEFPQNEQTEFTNPANSIKPGDKIEMYASQDPSSGRITLKVADYGPNQAVRPVWVDATPNLQRVHEPSQAECIVESPTNVTASTALQQNVLFPLSNFATLNFTRIDKGVGGQGCDIVQVKKRKATMTSISSTFVDTGEHHEVIDYELRNADNASLVSRSQSENGQYRVKWLQSQ